MWSGHDVDVNGVDMLLITTQHIERATYIQSRDFLRVMNFRFRIALLTFLCGDE